MHIIDVPEVPSPEPVKNGVGKLSNLTIMMFSKDTSLNLNTNESYTLNVFSSHVEITAPNAFGILRGLETFAQLVRWDGTYMTVPYVPIKITDSPAYAWRGLMIDTARHYLSMKHLYALVDSMTYAKLNVLHWHFVDAESFPMQIPGAMEFSKYGAWASEAIYTPKDVAALIKYAHYRGIRVVPEIDTPGHTWSFGKAHPSMILNCEGVITRGNVYPRINSVCLNMTNDDIYPLLDNIYGGTIKLFSDDYIHLGGDEVQMSCLNEFKESIQDWMRSRGMDTQNYLPLLQYFRSKLTPMITQRNRKMIVWQEALTEMVSLGNANPLTPDNTIAHLWINDDMTKTFNETIQLGFPTLISAGWYLDQQLPNPNTSYFTNVNISELEHLDGKIQGMTLSDTTHYLNIDTWQDFYKLNPFDGLDLTDDQKDLLLGGEVPQWSEFITPHGFLYNIWPRAAAVAERLWVGFDRLQSTSAAYHRLIRFQCYLYQRGVPTSGLRPNYCTSDVFDPPFQAGGLKVEFPVFGFVILGSLILALIIVVIVLAVEVHKLRKEKVVEQTDFEMIQ